MFSSPFFYSATRRAACVCVCVGAAEGMNEDGSFIGQYGRKGGKNADSNSQAFATLV